jgi:hypothetical protein
MSSRWRTVPTLVQQFAIFLLAAALSACSVERKEVRRIRSPDGRVDAVLVRTNAGATTPFGWDVYVVPAGEHPSKKDENFAADELTPDSLSIRWLRPKVLEIAYDHARIYHFSSFWESPKVDNYGYVVELRLRRTGPP